MRSQSVPSGLVARSFLQQVQLAYSKGQNSSSVRELFGTPQGSDGKVSRWYVQPQSEQRGTRSHHGGVAKRL